MGSDLYERFMQSIYRGEIVSHSISTQSSSTDFRWQEVPHHLFKTGTHYDEEQEEDEVQDTDSALPRPMASKPIVRVPVTQAQFFSDASLQQLNPVSRLNFMTSAVNMDTSARNTRKNAARELPQPSNRSRPIPNFLQSRIKTAKGAESPFWSSSSDESDESDAERREESGRDNSHVPGHRRSQTFTTELKSSPPSVSHCSGHATSKADDDSLSGDEWDLIEADLERSFEDNNPDAAMKARRFDQIRLQIQPPVGPNDVVRSIESEENQALDSFTQELLATAFGPIPTPIPIKTPKTSKHTVGRSPPIKPSDKARGANHAVKPPNRQQARHVKATNNHTRLPRTPMDKLNETINLVGGEEDANDEDFVIVGSGPVRKVRLPLRLSTSEESISYIDLTA